MDRETELREQLRELAERYRDEAQPIVDELAAINARKPLPPIMIPAAMAGELLKSPLPSLDDLIWGTNVGVQPKKD